MFALFIDETKNQDFVFVGCLAPSKDLANVRKVLKAFLLQSKVQQTIGLEAEP